MLVTTGRPSAFTIGAWLVGASVLLVGACLAPGPDRDSLLEPEIDAPPEAPSIADGPAFTPYTVAPALLNRAEVAAALEREYPPLLREAGIGGEVRIWLHVDTEGRVTSVRIDERSGSPPLDDAALKVADVMRFEPARNRDEAVAVWTRIPIVFGTSRGAGGEPEAGEPAPPSTASEPDPDLSSRPVFTPYSVGPEITNRAEVTRALDRAYPAVLRDAGIGGSARVWFFIDEEGRVQDTRIETSSGHAELDRAALAVADVMRFTPALNRDQPVPVWVTFPVRFQTR